MPSPHTGPPGLPPSPQMRKFQHRSDASPRIRRNMPQSSPPTRSRLYAKVSSIVEGSFLDTMHNGNGTADDLRGIGSFGTGSIRASPRFGNKQFGSRIMERRASLTHVVPSQAVTESVRLKDEKTETVERNVISFVVVYTMIFFNGCCFTAVVPSVPFYLHYLGAPPSFLGLVVSFYSLGQFVGSPVAGWLNDRVESRTLLTLSSLLGLIASTFYAVALNQWFILLSRVMTGVSAGMEFTTELAFIARNTTNEERTTFLASVTAINVLGFIMGPALTTVLSMLNFEFAGLVVNEYTGPGWLLVIMFFIDFLLIRFLFEDSSSLADDDANINDASTSALLEEENDNDSGGVPSYGAISEEKKNDDMENGTNLGAIQDPAPPSPTLVMSLIFTQFTVMCAWSVLETITSPLAADSFGWSVQECNILFTCGGAASLLAYISFVIASKWIEDRWLIAYALIACFVGLILMIHGTLPFLPPYKYCFLAGYLIMNAGFMTGRPVTFALYSKLMPPQYQGEYLGYMVAGGSAARTIGPFVAVFLYYRIEGPWKNTLALFGSESLLMIICLVLIITSWSTLLPDKAKSTAERKHLLDKSPNGTPSPSSANGDISLRADEKKLAQ